MDRKMIMESISKKIRDKRIERGLKHADIMQLTGLTRSSIVNIEKGRHAPRIETLHTLCCILHIQPNDLFPKVEFAKLIVSEEIVTVEKKYKVIKIQ